VVDELIQKINEQPIPDSETKSEKLDHSFFLKVASEINLMERNLSLMDANTRGKKQLERSVNDLKNNLSAHEYKIVPLLGKQHSLGMKVQVVNSTLDENMEPGDEIITKVIVPLVLFRNKMIQAAQIELTVGPEKNDDDPDTNDDNPGTNDDNSGTNNNNNDTNNNNNDTDNNNDNLNTILS
jgi:hypothetical protein